MAEEALKDVKIDKHGGEYRVVEGQEMFALWLPMSLAEKEAMMKKATEQKTHVGILVANFLRQWLKGETPAELSLKDLESVAGGMLNLYTYSSKSTLSVSRYTDMCPW